MAEQRLPVVNSDDGVWGEVLNQFIEKEHYNTGLNNVANGSHKTVNIRPGSTAVGSAPLKFNSGPLLSTPEAGAVEFLTDRLYLTQTTSTIRKTIATYDDSSGATGDLYYRDASGNFIRLAVSPTAGSVLNVSGGLPAWGPATATASTASTIALRDANANLNVNNLVGGYATTATLAGTTTLTVASAGSQFFTGSTTQTVVMPAVSTLVVGQQWQIINNSTGVDALGAITVQSSGLNTILILPSGSRCTLSCISISGTGASSWAYTMNSSHVVVSKTDPSTIATPSYGDIWVDIN